MTITKAQLFDMGCNLKARLDAKEGARAMLHELDRRGGMQRQSGYASPCESRTAADR